MRRRTEAAIKPLFAVDEGLPCPEGTALLLAFAKNRPSDFAFLQPSDLIDFTQFHSGDPITIRAARRVGDILKHVPSGRKVNARFRYFTS